MLEVIHGSERGSLQSSREIMATADVLVEVAEL